MFPLNDPTPLTSLQLHDLMRTERRLEFKITKNCKKFALVDQGHRTIRGMTGSSPKDPTMSSSSSPSGTTRNPQSFQTLDYVHRAVHPSTSEPDVPALHELPRPHIDSFDSIFDDGLLDMAVQNLDPKELIDAAGNRLSCTNRSGTFL